ncbi:MAG: CusA/CzcA family heavy metal efflux RND transporter [Polyangia bacterium]
MLERIIHGSIKHRLLVLAGTAALIFFGARAFIALPIDAVPDLTNVQVQVLTSAPALAPLDIERLVTIPVEFSMTGLPKLAEIRSISRYGTSTVTVVFEDGVDPYFARQLVGERMARARELIPSEYGVPELGPMSTGLGEIYQFEVRGEGKSPMEIRSILDWDISPKLRMVPGVVEVNAFGGELKTYEVTIDPDRMLAAQVSIADLVEALQRNNRSTGGGAIQHGAEGVLVRGDALISSLDDLGEIVVATRKGVPIYVRDLGEVRFAPMLRQGATTRDGRGEIVAGMAMMLMGENSRHVARLVQAEVDRLNLTLPAGVHIEPFYDRTTIVDRTIHTVEKNLTEGGVLVIVVLFLMLRNIRAGLIAAAMIPLAMMFAFIGMRMTGVSGNLMSLGAIDFGLVVDGAIILLENAIHHIAEERTRLGRPLARDERDDVVLRSALEVRSATAFGEVIIALVYLPILTLEGVEGKMFRPMALTVIFALAGAFIMSLTLVPALSSLILSRDTVDRPSVIVRGVRRVYEPLLRRTMQHPFVTAGIAFAVFVVSVVCATRLGSEFVPRLDEGAIVIETNRLPSTSLAESIRQGTLIERTLRDFSEVATVVVKTGRPEIANDPMGVEQSDAYVILKDAGGDHTHLVERMQKALHDAIPGASFGFSQPIEMRMNELVSGVRSDVAVKVYGPDLSTLSHIGARIGRILQRTRGAEDLKIDRVEGLPVLRARIDRLAVARFGANASDVLDAIETIGGHSVGEVLEGRRRFGLRVRLPEAQRNDLDSIERIPVRTATHFAPLADLAELRIEDEPLVISREGTERRLIVQANVRGRDLGGFANEAQAVVAQQVRLPPGYHLEWGGQFENLRRARSRLLVVVPLALVLIIALLYATFRAGLPAALILTNVPFAATGGVLALTLRGLPFSISAGVGFIALFGVAVLNGLVLISQIRHLVESGEPIEDAAREGALRRLRPVLTTALVASLGFVPMALASGAGAEVQRPLATVVIGGLISSTFLTLVVLPALYARLARRTDRGDAKH